MPRAVALEFNRDVQPGCQLWAFGVGLRGQHPLCISTDRRPPHYMYFDSQTTSPAASRLASRSQCCMHSSGIIASLHHSEDAHMSHHHRRTKSELPARFKAATNQRLYPATSSSIVNRDAHTPGFTSLLAHQTPSRRAICLLKRYGLRTVIDQRSGFDLSLDHDALGTAVPG